jgi:hypothetical protein
MLTMTFSHFMLEFDDSLSLIYLSSNKIGIEKREKIKFCMKIEF